MRKVGYNPTKPGRPSHAYHSYFIGSARIVLDTEVQAGNQTAPSFAQPELWGFLDGLEESSRPLFLRGDSHWGSEKAMLGAEQREIGNLGLELEGLFRCGLFQNADHVLVARVTEAEGRHLLQLPPGSAGLFLLATRAGLTSPESPA